MANNFYTREFTGNRVMLLAQKMRFEATREFFWAPLVGYSTKGGVPVSDGNKPKASGKPITIQNEFGKQQGDLMKIPMMRALRGIPTIGTNQMAGFEEYMKINHSVVPIDILRHGVITGESSMDTQVTKDYKKVENAKPQLQKHYSEVMEMLQVSYAFYKGFSYNIIDTNNTRWSAQSTTIKSISHPNIFIAGQGMFANSKQSYSGSNICGTTGYETDLVNAMNNIATSHVFNMALLRNLKAQAKIRRIQPIIGAHGLKFRAIVAHPYQIASLEADPTFNSHANAVWVQTQAKNNPILSGCQYFAHGFAIYSSDSAVWPLRESSSTTQWGPSTIADLSDMDDFNDYESDTIFGAIVIGMDALFIGRAQTLRFFNRSDDYEELQAIAYRSLEGASRGDFWNDDDGTRGQYIRNDGSAVILTYASEPQI